MKFAFRTYSLNAEAPKLIASASPIAHPHDFGTPHTSYSGVEPGPRQIEELVALMKKEGVRLIVKESFYSDRIPDEIANELTEQFYEVKAVFDAPTFDDRVRTFCMCPHGEVVTEYQSDSGLVIVNGHSNRDRKTQNTKKAKAINQVMPTKL